MSTKSVLLICIFIYAEKEFTEASDISYIIRSSYESFRLMIEKMNSVSRVRTVSELHKKGNEFALLDFIGLVQQHDGYEAEEYDVQTEDGYILKLHRISSSPYSPKASNKSVVFIQHGFLGSSDQFVNLGPDHGLAYLLADAGYDIWLGNVRGNDYSRRHVKYVPTSFNYDFWKFNIDDIGTKDTPTLIDNVLEKSNKTKLVYIGYSMGTSMSYMFLSTRPEYNDKIDLSIGLAPAAYFAEPFTMFFKFAMAIRPVVLSLGAMLRIYEILPLSKLVVAFAKTICTNSIGKYLCVLILHPLIHFRNINITKISSMLAVTFNGASPDTSTHLCQLAMKKKFSKFDFGPTLNQAKYNSSEPPEYDLSKISVPQALFYAVEDTFVHPEGAKRTKDHLKNVVLFERVPDTYRHFDFMWSKDARSEFYYKILNLINRFT